MNVADLKLPQLMAVACEAGGMDAVARLAQAFGGQRIYIPKETCPPNHPLVVVAGQDVADGLVEGFGGGLVEFPRGGVTLRLYLAAGLFAAGKSDNQVADALDITYRAARRLKKRLKGRGALARALAELVPQNRKASAQIDLEDWLRQPKPSSHK
jgi:hypothetical protein